MYAIQTTVTVISIVIVNDCKKHLQPVRLLYDIIVIMIQISPHGTK